MVIGWLARLWCFVVREVWYLRLNWWLPRLVWLDDELDVVVSFTDFRLPDDLDVNGASSALFAGTAHEIEQRLRQIGIGFDRGMGSHGRDWEWDWSLTGPISVRFRGRASAPERRCSPARVLS